MRLSIAIALMFVSITPPAHAWELTVGRLRAGGIELHNLSIDRSGDQAKISAARIDGEEIGLHQAGLTINCSTLAPAPDAIGCAGDLRMRKPAWRGRIDLQQTADARTLRLDVDKARLLWRSAIGSEPMPSDITLSKVPIVWLSERLRAAWSDLASIGGTLNAKLRYAADGSRLQGDWAWNAGEFDSTAGDIGGAGLHLAGPVDIDLGTRMLAKLQLKASRGQLLLGPVYFDLPETDSVLDLQLAQDAGGNWQFPVLAWNDAQGMAFNAALSFDSSDAVDLRIAAFDADLAPVVARYLATAVAAGGFEGLRASGKANGSARYANGGWQAIDIGLEHAAIADPQQRIEIDRIDGNLCLDVIAANSQLVWQGARVYRIPLGEGEAKWRWTPDLLQLSQPISIDLMGGHLKIPSLERRSVDGIAAIHTDVELDRIDMLQLSTALDWPHFAGSLSGRLPGLVIRDGGFTSAGDLTLKVFDGSMRIATVNSERTFGVAPTLGADITFDNLDLKQLSAALDFGEIEGWLDGYVRKLRLVDWTPVAFEARLRTDDSFRGRKRISQRAVQGLSSVGGGGSTAGNPLMKLFDSFPYAQIGLDCTLADNICSMGGLDVLDHGYTILRGAGLPRLTVVGHQPRVDWPVLLSRLQAASSGQAPVIE